jgi:hypothetical protein
VARITLRQGPRGLLVDTADAYSTLVYWLGFSAAPCPWAGRTSSALRPFREVVAAERNQFVRNGVLGREFMSKAITLATVPN